MYLLISAIASSFIRENIIPCNFYPLNASVDWVQMLGADERFTLSNNLQTFSYAYDGSLVSGKTIGATTQGAPTMPSQSFDLTTQDDVRFVAELEIDSLPTGIGTSSNGLSLFVLDMSLNDELKISLNYDDSPTGLTGSAYKFNASSNGTTDDYYLQSGSKIGIYYSKSAGKYGFVISGFDSSGAARVGDIGYSSNSIGSYDLSDVFIAVQANEIDNSGLSGSLQATLTIDGSEAMSGYPGGAVDNCGNLLESSLQFDINFASGYYYADGSARTLAEVMDYTRPNPAWVVDTDYVLHEFAADELPVVNKPGDGAFFWDAATNLLLNSDAPATQTVTVTDATAYTLSVWSQDGTGSAEITAGGSGTATGNWRDQNHLTFTSSGTSVTVTVSGNVDYIQLEEGDNATEFIKTGASAVTRSAFTESQGTALITALLNDSEGTLVVEAVSQGPNGSYIVSLYNMTTGLNTNSINHDKPLAASRRYRFNCFSSGTREIFIHDRADDNAHTESFSYAPGEAVYKYDGAIVGSSATYTTPSGLDTIVIGENNNYTAPCNGRIKRITYYNTKGAV